MYRQNIPRFYGRYDVGFERSLNHAMWEMKYAAKIGFISNLTSAFDYFYNARDAPARSEGVSTDIIGFVLMTDAAYLLRSAGIATPPLAKPFWLDVAIVAI